MPRLGSEEDRTLAGMLDTWIEHVRDQVEDIRGWREDPARKEQYEPWGTPETIEYDTPLLIAHVANHLPKCDPGPLRDIANIIIRWNERRTAEGIPPQSDIDEAMRGVWDVYHGIWKGIESRMLKGPADGPVPPDGLAWNGKEYRGLSPLPWKLLAYCWESPNRTGSYDRLAAAVWGDEEYDCYGEPLKQTVKKLREWLKRNGIPLRCTFRAERRAVWLEEIS